MSDVQNGICSQNNQLKSFSLLQNTKSPYAYIDEHISFWWTYTLKGMQQLSIHIIYP